MLAALWGASFLFIRVTAREFGAMPTAGLRVGFAALFLLSITSGFASIVNAMVPLFGALVAWLLACLCYAIAASCAKKFLTGVAPMAIATGSQPGAVVGLMAPMIWRWPAGPARALAVTFLVPVFALAYGVMLLGEVVSTAMLVCGSVIVLGTALSTGMIKPSAKPSAPS